VEKPAGLPKKRIGPQGRAQMDRGLIAVGLALVVLASTGSSTPGGSLRSIAFAESATQVYPLPSRVASPQIDEHLEATVLDLVNQERVATGISPLMPHATIQGAARAHGREMFAWGYLGHLSRDGRTPRDRVLGLGVRVRLIGENLAYAADVRAAHDALMASEGHRQNILFPQYRLVGIAVVDGGPDGVIVVEDFSDEGIIYHLPKWWEPITLPAIRTHGR
jgi:uncharacterized protein YkwD